MTTSEPPGTHSIAEQRTEVFRLHQGRTNPFVAAFRPSVEALLGLRRLRRLYLRLPECDSPEAFVEAVFARWNITVSVAPEDLERIPATGPVVVVANHPFGGIEGLALALVLGSARNDYRIIANYILGRIPELKEIFLLVDPFETPDSPRRSLSGLRQTYRWLDGGGMVALFPAGEVAHLHLRHRDVVDPPWTSTVARLVRHAECPVVPLYFDGRNGPLFQMLGLVHPVIRTAMLPREFLAHRGRAIEVRVGSPIPYSQLRSCEDDGAMVALMRRRTEILAERSRFGAVAVQPRRTPEEASDVIEPVPPAQLEAEIAALPAEALLAAAGQQEVWIAEAAAAPGIVREIGRLREVTFRAVGEGTGRELDLDRFDDTYLHLFIWHRKDREIVGGYRIGRTDRLIEAEGLQGLYTSTLFRFNPRLFEAMGPALEMGRSFVRPEYQKSFSGLLLLWKGIGRYVQLHPEAPVLFGPVSISADYRTASQQFLVSFLKSNNYRHEWSRWVRPRTPFKGRPSKVIRRGLSDLADLDEVSQFIAEIEDDRKGAPILLKQYLKLGGRLLAFNVDPDFSNVLDVLIMVDLRLTDRRTLTRYMGADGVEAFLSARTP